MGYRSNESENLGFDPNNPGDFTSFSFQGLLDEKCFRSDPPAKQLRLEETVEEKKGEEQAEEQTKWNQVPAVILPCDDGEAWSHTNDQYSR